MDAPLLATLQAVRLKGRATLADILAATALDEAAATKALNRLSADSLLREAGDRLRLTPDGKAALAAGLDDERTAIDQPALRSLYEDFDPLNSELKQLASAWQQRDGEQNDHADSVYDARVLAGVDRLHADLAPLLQQLVEVVPRLAPYPARFACALDRIHAGEHAYFLRPVIDSYHTVWFELHEDLIGLLGRSRQDEALAGRAD